MERYKVMKNLRMFNILLVFLAALFLAGCNPAEFLEEKDNEFAFEDLSGEAGIRGPSSLEEDQEQFRSIQMQNRFYIASVFEQVFGPTFNRSNIIRNTVINKQGVFGGNCDVYTRSRVGTKGALEFPYENCLDPNWNTDMAVTSTTLREGWMLQACERTINENAAGVNYAFEKAGVSQDDSEVNLENLNALYKLFYPLESIDQDSANFMISESQNFESNSKFWEASLLTFCISPKWQSF
mgnify:CR=1 FL=1